MFYVKSDLMCALYGAISCSESSGCILCMALSGFALGYDDQQTSTNMQKDVTLAKLCATTIVESRTWLNTFDPRCSQCTHKIELCLLEEGRLNIHASLRPRPYLLRNVVLCLEHHCCTKQKHHSSRLTL